MTGPTPCTDCGGYGSVGDEHHEQECRYCDGPMVCAVCDELAVPPVCDPEAVWWLGQFATVYCSESCLTADAEGKADAESRAS